MNHFPKLTHSVNPLSHSVEIYQDLKYVLIISQFYGTCVSEVLNTKFIAM